MRILFIGDVVGKPGREIIERAMPGLVREQKLDLVVANAENAAVLQHDFHHLLGRSRRLPGMRDSALIHSPRRKYSFKTANPSGQNGASRTRRSTSANAKNSPRTISSA